MDDGLTNQDVRCSRCARILELAEYQIDIGEGGKTYYSCECHKDETILYPNEFVEWQINCVCDFENNYGTHSNTCLTRFVELVTKRRINHE